MKFIPTKILLLLIFVSDALLAQVLEPQEPTDSKELIQKAVEQHDLQDYESAVYYYSQVNPSDTNYVTVLAEKALSLMYDKKYEESIKTAQKALRLDNGKQKNYLLNIIANNYDDLDQTQRAIDTYNEVLESNPFDDGVLYNLAITQYRQGNTQEAMEAAQKAINLNPTYASPHAFLGRVALAQGYETRAIMAFTTALLVSDVGSQEAKGFLAVLEEISKGASVLEEEDRKKPTMDNELFAEIDAIIAGKVALNRGYKAKVKIEGAILKQWQVIFEKFRLKQDSEDFYMDYYGALFQRMIDEEQLVTLSYYGAATAEIPKAIKFVNKKRRYREEFIANIASFLFGQRLSQYSYPDEDDIYNVWFSQNNVVAIGNSRGTGGESPYGKWRYFYENGNLQSVGTYDNNNKRQGDWKFYNEDGDLVSVQTFKDNVVDGKVLFFYPKSEQIAEERTYVKDKLEGVLKSYFKCGQQRFEANYKNEKKEGVATTYFPDGNVRQTETFKNGELDGPTTIFYPDGTKSYLINYKEGKKDGEFLSYDREGKVVEKTIYKNGKVGGNFATYFDNGQLRKKGSFDAENKPLGTWETLDYYGNKRQTRRYFEQDKERLVEEINFDAKGTKLNTYIFKVGKGDEDEYNTLKSMTFYDKEGNTLASYQDLDSRSEQAIKILYSDGRLRKEGKIKNGKSVGEWTEYHHSGTKTLSTNNEKGKQEGETIEYFANGQMYKKVNYKNDEPDGAFVKYYRNGTIAQTGWYDEGKKVGDWIDYSPDGNKEGSTYYLNDNQFGYDNIYSPEGKLVYQTYTYGGDYKFTTSFDKEENEIAYKPMDVNAKDTFTTVFYNKKPRIQTFYECGAPVGTQTFYYGNGQAQSVIKYEEGKRHGKAKGYYPDGKIRYEGSYFYGDRHGEWKWYHRNGKVETIGTYYYDEKDGTWIDYHDNGTKSSESIYDAKSDYDDNYPKTIRWYNYENDLVYERNFNKYDEIINYSSEGTAQTPVEIKVGEKVVIKTNYKNGQTALEETRESGMLQGERTYYFKNGQKAWSVNYKDGQRSGTLTAYYPDGTKRYEKPYTEVGRINGTVNYYYPNGKLQTSYAYMDSEKHGDAKFYDEQGKLLRVEIYYNDELVEIEEAY